MKFQTLAVISFLIMCVISACSGQNRMLGDNTLNSVNPTPTPPGQSQVINFQTTAVTMAATATAKTLTWNLATQLSGASPLPGGGTFKIQVQVYTSGTGQTSYEFTLPSVTGGTSAILVQNVGFIINGQAQSNASTFWAVNRMIPASPGTRILSSTSELIPMTINATDTVAITFATLQPTVFAPPTYTQLTGTGGVFQVNCQSCHNTTSNNPAGNNMDLTKSTTAYNHLISYFEAVPFQPANSLIIEHMTMSNGLPVMPPSGMIGGASIQSVSDWINDGAPNN